MRWQILLFTAAALLAAGCSEDSTTIELRPGEAVELEDIGTLQTDAATSITYAPVDRPNDLFRDGAEAVSPHLSFQTTVPIEEAILEFPVPEGSHPDLLVGIHWSDDGWELLPTETTDDSAIVTTHGFSEIQLVELRPGDIERKMRQRFVDHVDLAAIQARDHVETCQGPAGFELEIRGGGLISTIGTCTAGSGNGTTLEVTLFNSLNSGIFLSGGDGVLSADPSRPSITERFSDVMDLTGAALVPAGGSISFEVDPLGKFPIQWNSYLDSNSLTLDLLTLGLGMKFNAALGIVRCVDGIISEYLPDEEAETSEAIDCVLATFPQIPKGAADVMAEGLVRGLLDGSLGRAEELAGALFGDTGEATITLRRTPDPLDATFAGLLDKTFTYNVEGFRLQATIHLSQIQFPLVHDCQSTGMPAPPGRTWITIPLTILNLQTDRPGPAIAPAVVLGTSGGETISLLSANVDFFSGGNCLLYGSFDDSGGITPGGSVTGLLVVAASTSNDAPMPENYDPHDYAIAVRSRGLGVFYQLEDPLPGPWDLTGRVLPELQS